MEAAYPNDVLGWLREKGLTPISIDEVSAEIKRVQRAPRKKRVKSKLVSKLDQIPGVGPSRKKALLKNFGSLEGVRNAKPEELQIIRGITEDLANSIIEFLNQ